MGTLSKSSEIAVQIAEYEAIRSRHKSIEPEHFLLGILSLEKVFEAGAQAQFQLNRDAVDSVRVEFEPLQAFLRAKGVNPPLMRRSLRELLQKYVSPKLEQAGTVPRPSPKIQDLCVRAAGVTEAMKSPEIRIEHFLIALIEDKTSGIPGLLQELRLQPEELVAEVRLRTSRQGTHAIRVVNATDAAVPEVPLRDVSLAKTEILEAVDATRSMQMAVPSTKASASRFTLLCDLPSQIEKETRIEPILHRFLTGLIEAIPGATGGAVLMKGRNEEELLLKAHVSRDEPAVNLAAACQAMETKQGFISRLESELKTEERPFSMYAPMVWKGEVLGVMCVDGADPHHSFESDDLKILVAVAQHACLIINDLQMQEDLKRNAALLERLLTNFSPKVRSRLLERARRGRLQLGGERSEVTLLFSDIRNFTTLSAGMDTEDVLEMLNQCFSVSADSIFKFDGTID